jgi:hypothetical protein
MVVNSLMAGSMLIGEIASSNRCDLSRRFHFQKDIGWHLLS